MSAKKKTTQRSRRDRSIQRQLEPTPSSDPQEALTEQQLEAFHGDVRFDWRAFATWCAKHDVSFLPAAPNVVVSYLGDMVLNAKPLSMLKRTEQAISAVHESKGLDDPCASKQVEEWHEVLNEHSREPSRDDDPPYGFEELRDPGRLAEVENQAIIEDLSVPMYMISCTFGHSPFERHQLYHSNPSATEEGFLAWLETRDVELSRQRAAERGGPVNEVQASILCLLADADLLMSISDIAENNDGGHSRSTCGDWMPDLEARGYVDRPQGPQKGYRATPNMGIPLGRRLNMRKCG